MVSQLKDGLDQISDGLDEDDDADSTGDAIDSAAQLAAGLNAALTQLTGNNEALETVADNLITNGTGEENPDKCFRSGKRRNSSTSDRSRKYAGWRPVN